MTEVDEKSVRGNDYHSGLECFLTIVLKKGNFTPHN